MDCSINITAPSGSHIRLVDTETPSFILNYVGTGELQRLTSRPGNYEVFINGASMGEYNLTPSVEEGEQSCCFPFSDTGPYHISLDIDPGMGGLFLDGFPFLSGPPTGPSLWDHLTSGTWILNEPPTSSGYPVYSTTDDEYTDESTAYTLIKFQKTVTFQTGTNFWVDSFPNSNIWPAIQYTIRYTLNDGEVDYFSHAITLSLFYQCFSYLTRPDRNIGMPHDYFIPQMIWGGISFPVTLPPLSEFSISSEVGGKLKTRRYASYKHIQQTNPPESLYVLGFTNSFKSDP